MECIDRKGNRLRKLEAKKLKRLKEHRFTPPKMMSSSATWLIVNGWASKFGYDFECDGKQCLPWNCKELEVSQRLKDMRQEFRQKAEKYCGGDLTSVKKQSRFDKMRMKEEMNFSLGEMPLRKKLRRVDLVVERAMMRVGFCGIARRG
jgi:hypothetical protein